jgi:hypothetical protein
MLKVGDIVTYNERLPGRREGGNLSGMKVVPLKAKILRIKSPAPWQGFNFDEYDIELIDGGAGYPKGHILRNKKPGELHLKEDVATVTSDVAQNPNVKIGGIQERNPKEKMMKKKKGVYTVVEKINKILSESQSYNLGTGDSVRLSNGNTGKIIGVSVGKDVEHDMYLIKLDKPLNYTPSNPEKAVAFIKRNYGVDVSTKDIVYLEQEYGRFLNVPEKLS